MPLAPPIFLESPPNFRLITRNPFSLHCVWGQHWIFCANNVQSLINNLINTWNIRFSKKMCYFNTKSNEFSWFTHICCKTLSSWFTHFFRQIFGAEILALPKVQLLECMHNCHHNPSSLSSYYDFVSPPERPARSVPVRFCYWTGKIIDHHHPLLEYFLPP